MIRVDIRKKLQAKGGCFHLDLNFSVKPEGIIAITGPSGAGKTSLLRMLAGLLPPDDGTIQINGETWFDSSKKINLRARKRGIGYVFQDYALFPNMTVSENISYGCPDHEQAEKLIEKAGMKPISGLYPSELSGGQQQRVALLRALARDPSLLLMDEPLSALDHDLRASLQTELKEIRKRLGIPAFLVTHDTEEISRLADYTIRIENGRIAAMGLS